jgi:excisionase family DNA binding protein
VNDHASNNGYEPDLLTVPEAAKLLRISRNLAYELVARQQLPCVRLGRVIRVPRSALDAWIGRQATPQRLEGNDRKWNTGLSDTPVAGKGVERTNRGQGVGRVARSDRQRRFRARRSFPG